MSSQKVGPQRALQGYDENMSPNLAAPLIHYLAVGAAVFRSSLFVAIFLGTAFVLSPHHNRALAQFGGTQDLMLQRQQQQQQQITKGSADRSRAAPPHSGHHPHSGHSHKPRTNNYYFQLPGYTPYGYYNQYPPVNPYLYEPYGYGHPYGGVYGNYYGNAYGLGIYAPRVTVVPHGVPLTNDLLNGTYGNWNRSPLGMNPGINPGMDPRLVQPEQPALAPAAAGPPAPEDEIKRRVAALKPSTEAGRLRSDELIADGDREFRDQQYREAARTYREAITKAPDYPPGHLRAGHAYIATGDYELAVTYLAMGFELSRTIERPGFSLTDLYQGNDVAKDQHQESLADAILRQPDDGGLLFLAGVMQHYDGRPLQARDYFRRAAELPGRHQPYAAMFLPRPAEQVQEENEN